MPLSPLSAPGAGEAILPGPGGPAAGGWLRFSRPVVALAAASAGDLPALLAGVDEALAAGLWVAGFVAHEAAPAFDPAFVAHPPREGLPLAWFGVYGRPAPAALPPPPPLPQLRLRPELDRAGYVERVEEVRRAIARGDTYQVNLTFRLRGPLGDLDPWPLFLQLAASGQARYGGWLDLGGAAIASASPELFFRRRGHRVVTRPMKGTARRGRFAAEDEARARLLRASAKERAENLMIVDMARHDLGRIAETGSVRVDQLFAVEPYPTVWQLTSTVSAEVRSPFSSLLAALFPAASVTGAPKSSTTALIARLERSPRGPYTGALGWAGPGGEARFGVAIRTALVDRERDLVEYGVGSGVVWDSRPEREWRECRAKAAVLADAGRPAALFETLRWSPRGGFFLLDRHLDRLTASAARFGIPCRREAPRAALDAELGRLSGVPHRVRLELARDGGITVESAPLPPRSGPWRLALAPRPVDVRDPLLFHKTVHREIYDEARRARPEADDVLLWNRRGELTESTVANLALRLDGRWWTPPVASGLLPGTLRAELLARGRLRERALPLAALERAESIRLFNSVRGFVRVGALERGGPGG